MLQSDAPSPPVNRDVRAWLRRGARIAQRECVRLVASTQPDDETGALVGTIPALDGWAATVGKGRVVYLPDIPPVQLSASQTTHVPPSFTTNGVVQFPKPYAATVAEGRLLSGEGHFIVERRLVLDVSPAFERDERDHPALLRWRRSPPSRLDASALILAGYSPRNHYHWLLDILPRYAVAREAGMTWTHLVTYLKTPVHHACLQRLGVTPEQVVAPPWHGQLDVAEAVVATIPALPLVPSDFSVRFLRDLMAAELQPATHSPRRLYVRRSSTGVRRVRNESELRRLLEDLRFTTVDLESLSFSEQVRLFANADVVVGPHGAGLANLAFCRPGTRVVELFARRYTPRCYQYLSAIAGLDYRCLMEGGDRPRKSMGRYLPDDMTVDAVALAKLLRDL